MMPARGSKWNAALGRYISAEEAAIFDRNSAESLATSRGFELADDASTAALPPAGAPPVAVPSPPVLPLLGLPTRPVQTIETPRPKVEAARESRRAAAAR